MSDSWPMRRAVLLTILSPVASALVMVRAASLVLGRRRSPVILLVVCLFVALGSLTATPTTGQAQNIIRGTVFAFDMFGNLVPLGNALVVATSDGVAFSTQTAADGTFELTVPPGTYDVTASAEPPASNINPSTIEGRVLQSAQDMFPVVGADVTAEPHCSGEDFGDSVATDLNGFFSLTARRFNSLQPSTRTVVLPEGVEEVFIAAIDFQLYPVGTPPQCSEPGIFSLRVTHPSYPTKIQRLGVLPGSGVHLDDIFLDAAPPSNITVSYQGSDYVAVVHADASTSDLHFDTDRRLLNFTLSGADGTVGSFVVVTPKAMLDGSPVVFVDNAPVDSTYAENDTHYFVRFSCTLSMHTATLGGSNTIPEFPFSSVILAISMLATVVLRRRRKHSVW